MWDAAWRSLPHAHQTPPWVLLAIDGGIGPRELPKVRVRRDVRIRPPQEWGSRTGDVIPSCPTEHCHQA